MQNLSFVLRMFALLCAGVLLITQAAAGGGFAVDVDEKGIALKGHDPVAYFAVGKSIMGSADYTANIDGTSYHFASAGNRDQFIANPAKYTAAYGGFCALGVTRSMKIKGDPAAWKIVDGRLYINSSPKALGIWSEDIPANIHMANQAWPAIKEKDPADL